MISERPITPPSTPLWNQSQKTSTTAYPSPTTSSSKSTSPTSSSQTRPSLKPSFSTKSTSIRENVQVMVRCRPRSEKELKFDEEPCWLIRPEEGSIELARLKSPTTISTFHYDNVVMGVDNEQVYKAGILDLVRSAMMGYNGTVFAYGQTASGKTYTMMGTETEPGVIPRAVREVFSYIEEDANGREYLLRVSYMEIYNEKIKDLLNPENSSPEIVEDKTGVHVRNLKEVKVKTAQEVINCIKEGEGNRHISATDYNERSSRSHTIFQLIIESRSKGLPTNANQGVRVSQLNLIDLAGSEKVATDTERRKEGGYINKSLLTLGNVISKLTSEVPSTHIPFRNSKLTRILQAALSGNARISVICTINPTFASKDESLNTLRFAQRAKLVKTAAKMTRILDNSELQNCLIKIAELQTKMQEKTDLEAETRERLKNLLGLILTSSKKDADHPDHVEMFSQFSNISADDLMKESTMRDVVARCEEGFAAQIDIHQKQMDKMTQHVESIQDMMNIMESVHAKQNDTLAKRDAQVEKLKQELATIKSAQLQNTVMKSTSTSTAKATKTPIRATKTPQRQPIFPPPTATLLPPVPALQQAPASPPAPMPTPLPKPIKEQPEFMLDTMTPSITHAVQNITDAICTGLQQQLPQEEDYDMLSSTVEDSRITSTISDALTTIFKNALTPGKVFNEHEEVDVSKSTIINALQSAIQSSLTSSVVSTTATSTMTPEFTTINEAVSFVEYLKEPSSIIAPNSITLIEKEIEVPELIEEQIEAPKLIEEQIEVPELNVKDDEEFEPIELEETESIIFDNTKMNICRYEDNVMEDSSDEEMIEVSENEEAEDELVKDTPLIESPVVEESNAITPCVDPAYEPYSKSINQFTPFMFVFNRWAIVSALVYILLQN